MRPPNAWQGVALQIRIFRVFRLLAVLSAVGIAKVEGVFAKVGVFRGKKLLKMAIV